MQFGSEHAQSALGLKHKFQFSEAPGPLPLFIFVHGRAGTIDVMSIFKRALPKDAHLVFVEAPYPDPIGGFSWWLLDETPSQIQTAKEAGIRALNSFISEFPRYYDLDVSKRIAFGFSQGGAMLSLLVRIHPSLLSGLALLASFVPELEEREPGADLSHLELFVAHGRMDRVVTIDTLQSSLPRLTTKGAKLTMCQEDVGHKVGRESLKALTAWAGRFSDAAVKFE